MKAILSLKRKTPILVDDEDFERFSQMSWHITRKGYAGTNIRVGKEFRGKLMHRLIIGEVPAGMVIDHINGDKLDNRRSNLRLLTNSENCSAQRKPHCRNTSGVRGVSFVRGRYHVQYRTKHIGCFKTVEDASNAWRSYVAQVAGHLFNDL